MHQQGRRKMRKWGGRGVAGGYQAPHHFLEQTFFPRKIGKHKNFKREEQT